MCNLPVSSMLYLEAHVALLDGVEDVVVSEPDAVC